MRDVLFLALVVAFFAVAVVAVRGCELLVARSNGLESERES